MHSILILGVLLPYKTSNIINCANSHKSHHPTIFPKKMESEIKGLYLISIFFIIYLFLIEKFHSVFDVTQGGVFLLPGCCDPFNEKALRASRGACFQFPIVCGCWIHLEALKSKFQMKMLAGHPESNAELKSVFQLTHEFADSLVHVPLCLILGSEGSGLSEKSHQECELVSIPMAGESDSLNVSVAGGIFLYMLQPRI